MSFGSKLDEFPLVIPPRSEIIVTLQITPDGKNFERQATIYVEEANGLRALEITVRSAAQGSAS